MAYHIQLRDEKAMQVLSVRTRTSMEKLPEVLQEVFDSILSYLNETGGQAWDTPFCTYHGMGSAPPKPAGPIHRGRLPRGRTRAGPGGDPAGGDTGGQTRERTVQGNLPGFTCGVQGDEGMDQGKRTGTDGREPGVLLQCAGGRA